MTRRARSVAPPERPCGRIDDAASVYSIDGKQYVLIASGGSSLIGAGTGGFEQPSPATFTAFALG